MIRFIISILIMLVSFLEYHAKDQQLFSGVVLQPFADLLSALFQSQDPGPLLLQFCEWNVILLAVEVVDSQVVVVDGFAD